MNYPKKKWVPYLRWMSCNLTTVCKLQCNLWSLKCQAESTALLKYNHYHDHKPLFSLKSFHTFPHPRNTVQMSTMALKVTSQRLLEVGNDTKCIGRTIVDVAGKEKARFQNQSENLMHASSITKGLQNYGSAEILYGNFLYILSVSTKIWHRSNSSCNKQSVPILILQSVTFDQTYEARTNSLLWQGRTASTLFPLQLWNTTYSLWLLIIDDSLKGKIRWFQKVSWE